MHKRKNLKRVLSMLMTFAMILSLVGTAWALETHDGSYQHAKADFMKDGELVQECQTGDGCEYTLSQLQEDCEEDHDALLTTETCEACGAAGTKEAAAPAHTQDSAHALSDFVKNGDDGYKCSQDCGKTLTVAEYQTLCGEETNHDWDAEAGICNTCGAVCSHEDGDEDNECDICGKALTPTPPTHSATDKHTFADYVKPEGDVTEVVCGQKIDGESCTNKITLEAYYALCAEENPTEHEAATSDTACVKCGYKPEAQQPAGPHPDGYDHKFADYVPDGDGGYKCSTDGCTETLTAEKYQEMCGETAEGHSWNAETGTCKTCGADCPNADNHEEGVECDTCHYTKPVSQQPEHTAAFEDHTKDDFDFEGKCTKQLTSGDDCTYTLAQFQEDCQHSGVDAEKGGTCETCGKEIPAKPAHVHTFNEDVWEKDVTGHWHVGCTDADNCDAVDSATVKSGVEDHTFDANGKCTVCDYQCEHSNKTATALTGADAGYHKIVCDDCDAVIEAKELCTWGTGDEALTCTKCGYVHVHTWSDGDTADDYGHDGEQHWRTCTDANCPIKATAKNDVAYHVYDQEGDTKCVCGVVKPHEHTWSTGDGAADKSAGTGWDSDDSQHWRFCTDENCTADADAPAKNNVAAHTFVETDVGGETKLICSVCAAEAPDDYVDPGHIWSDDWTTDSTDPDHHWHACTVEHDGEACTEKNDIAAHVYDPDTGKCVCGAEKPHEHVWSTEWVNTDPNQHWHACQGATCDAKNDVAAHTFGDWTVTEEATETEAGSRERVCSVCSYKETEVIPATGGSEDPGPAPAHTHTFDETAWEKDASGHWHVGCTDAGCDADDPDTVKSAVEAHDTNGTDGACSVCGYKASSSGGNTGGNTGGSSGGSSGGGGGGSSSSSSSNTVKNPDGSTTTTTTDRTTGVKTETTTQPDGSTTVVQTQKDGTTTTVATNASGRTTATTVNVSAKAVTAAEGKPVELPMAAVSGAASVATAQTVTVTAERGGAVKVKIPVTAANPGTVAVIVNADGTTQVVTTSVVIGNGVVASLPSGTTVKIVDNGRSYADVAMANWANEPVNFVAARGLMVGTSANSFSPSSPMNCAMITTVLARLDGQETTGGANWYEKGMTWAAQNGININIAANTNVSREQLVTMIWRYVGSPESTEALAGFADAGQVSGDASAAMRWAVENGIIVGSNGALNPQGEITRAEVAQVLENLLKQLAQ